MKTIITSILDRYPRLKRMLKKVQEQMFSHRAVSSNYVPLRDEELSAEGRRLRDAWQNESVPQKQRELVERQLFQYRNGGRVDVFDVFVQSLRELPDTFPRMTLLEIGCSSGFYSEVVDIAKLPLTYSGCDYSQAFVNLAKEKYPNLAFSLEDATALTYPTSSFYIVVSGCCLLHIPEYQKAVAETVRVAQRYVIFHRTPVVWGQPEQWYRKMAYGIETVEIHFNEQDFFDLLARNNLELIKTYTLHEECLDPPHEKGHAIRTYVCRKSTK